MKLLCITELVCAFLLIGEFHLHYVASEEDKTNVRLAGQENSGASSIVHGEDVLHSQDRFDGLDSTEEAPRDEEDDRSERQSLKVGSKDHVTENVQLGGSTSGNDLGGETDEATHSRTPHAESDLSRHSESESAHRDQVSSEKEGVEGDCGRKEDNCEPGVVTVKEGSEKEGSPAKMMSPSLSVVQPESGLGSSQTLQEQEESSDRDEGLSQSKQRFFPLLYTFRTLFTSFLAEFTEESQERNNSSETSGGNSSVVEPLDKDNNSTGNGTDTGKKTRFQCAPKNITENTTGEVKVVNSTELLEILNFSKNQKVSTCVLVMFYAPWCHFCARTAPHYNALARAYPQLDVLAVDTSHFSYLNARFGTVAVPNVMLFHSRSAVRFNHTSRVLENFIEFVTNNTGMEPNVSVSVEAFDYFGPLPSTAVRGRDWLLWLAWAFVLTCSGYGFVRSHYGQGVINRLRVLWQEHQHIE